MKSKGRASSATTKNKKLALLSVSDKAGLPKFAKGLKKLGFDIVSTGGTAKALTKAGVKVTDVASLTGYPHMLGGRVKSLHPIIHGGILANRSLPEHLADMKKFKIRPIDMVVCNLYPFEVTISKPNCTKEQAIEEIDIGGPCMVRAAAKNHKDVAIVVDPTDYIEVLRELKKGMGALSLEYREKLALKAFRHTQLYDKVICQYLESSHLVSKDEFPSEVEVNLEKIQDLRYGENPHQKAALYREKGISGNIKENQGIGIVEAKQLHGKELSFNNIVDVESAWAVVNYFADTTVAIVKHNNPCGCAQDDKVVEAYKKALAGDPVSAYGGIIACNREIDGITAKEISALFVEVIIAPSFSAKALDILSQKKNLRLLVMPKGAVGKPFKGLDYKRVGGGFLIQTPDLAQLGMNEIKIVSKKQPSIGEMEDLFFAWGVAKHVKSNAIVLIKNKQVVGVGAGQMSRIDSTDIAVKKAGKKVKGTVLASDAFFPFRDNVDLAAKFGVAAIIQPGGSVRDEEVIQAADEHKLAMVFTGRRHFRH